MSVKKILDIFLCDISEIFNISNKNSLLIFLFVVIIFISHNLRNLDNCDSKYRLENVNFKIQS